MRALLKTAYAQDIRLFRYGGTGRLVCGLLFYAALLVIAPRGFLTAWGACLYALAFGIILLRRDSQDEGGSAAFWYGLLGVALLSAPLLADDYAVSQLSFVLTYAIAGIGLVLLSGQAGQISLGHAAFMAAGAYTEAILHNAGAGLLVSLPAACLVAAALGVLVGLPALRMRGIYLALATYAFAFIVEEILARWETVTGGNQGLTMDWPRLVLPGVSYGFESEREFYYLVLGVFAAALLAALNLMRSATGRAFQAVRDSEIAAKSMGVNVAAVKTTAFTISAGLTGIAGALYGHLLFTITPEGFTIFLSINLLLMIVVGGMGSLHGAVFGAIFLVVLPQLIASFRDLLPPALASQSGIESGIFGLIIILFVLFEPDGIYGRWVKIRAYFDLFPLYRKGSFRRQRRTMASERDR